MKHISKYFFSFCLVFSLFLTQAQENTKTKKDDKNTEGILPQNSISAESTVKDSIVKTERYGIRVGVDLFKLTKALYDSNYKGIELVGDYRLTKKYYLAAEIGSENKTTDDDRLNTTTKGSYLKVGFDYNAYENWLNMENIISIGLRYGFSTFSQDLNTYKIYNTNPYWGVVPPITSGENYSGLTASWIEVVTGVKVKVINNFFVGFSLRLNILVTEKKPSDAFQNLYIPGFNRTYDGQFGAGINYTVTYFLPIYKKKIKAQKATIKS